MDRLTEAGAVFETQHTPRSTLRHHRHRGPFATIVLRGSYTEVSDGAPRSAAPGALVVHGASDEHADHFLSEVHCLNVELPDGVFSGPAKMDESLRTAVERVVHAFYRDASGLHAGVVELQTLLRTRSFARATMGPQWLEFVLEAFEWCGAAPLRDAAKLAGVHPVQFSRAFHRHVGMTSNAYRRQQRVRRASELLLASAAPLACIAAHCGFADQSHLTRTFGETLGLSPAKYQRIFVR